MSIHDREHAMIDWETLDNKPTSIPLTLGAVKFNPYRGIVFNKFYRRWPLKSAQGLGLTMSPETITWWMTQSEAARQEAFGGTADLRTSMHEFAGWYAGCNGIWGHGSIFDISIMDNVYRALKAEPPYKYYDVRDTRTIYAAADIKPDRAAGTHHVAVDDAIQQAIAVCYAYRALGLAPFVGKVKLVWEEPNIPDHMPPVAPSDIPAELKEISAAVAQDMKDFVDGRPKISPEQIRVTADAVEQSIKAFAKETRVVIDPSIKY